MGGCNRQLKCRLLTHFTFLSTNPTRNVSANALVYLKCLLLWLTTQDVIHSLESTLRFVLGSPEKVLDDILSKQPPDKRLIKRLLYLQI